MARYITLKQLKSAIQSIFLKIRAVEEKADNIDFSGVESKIAANTKALNNKVDKSSIESGSSQGNYVGSVGGVDFYTGNINIDLPPIAKGLGTNSIVEGSNYTNTSRATGSCSHAEGSSVASDAYAHAEGENTESKSRGTHSEGYKTVANNYYSHAEGYQTKAGTTTGVREYGTHAEGFNTVSNGQASHAEGTGGSFTDKTSVSRESGATADSAHSEGYQTVALNQGSHSEGYNTVAGDSSSSTTKASHAEGWKTIASGNSSHAEGYNTIASYAYSHAEGNGSTASGNSSHAEGTGTTASGSNSHAEGYQTTASGSNSHAEGVSTLAKAKSQHVFGEYNIEDPLFTNASTRGKYVEIVGNGFIGQGSNVTNKNARTLDWDGNESLAGSITLGMGTADEVTVTAAQLKALLALLSSGE